jgi:hypothetical protein
VTLIGTASPFGGITIGGTVSSTSGAINLTAANQISVAGGVISTGGTLTLNGSSAGIGSAGNPFVVAAAFLNATTSGNGNLYFSTSGSTTIGSIGLSTGTGTVELEGGTFTFAVGTTATAGLIDVAGGTLAVNSSITVPITVGAAGTLKGSGSVGSVTNQGVVSPGNSPGILTINGNYTQTGSLTDEIQGTNPVVPDFDQLIVNGTVTLGGAPNTSLLAPFLPSHGNSFQIITNDGTDPVVGTFAGLPEGARFNLGSRFFTIS